ncbi:hypothetical protein M422DRAFT_240663 [Sphaerobolus stellatus SS14]|nr:hypothetical protein M422DRAFT_240663 [Sphaerobolus stellatus SS14]
MSHTSNSGNTADLLSCFHDQQAKRDEHCVEVGAVFGACFIYHPKACDQCSTYVEHLLADIDQRPAKFSFSKDEILDGLHEAWPHVSGYITDLNEEQVTLEKELFQEKADNCRLRDDMDDLKEKIQELEAQLLSLQPSTTVTSPTKVTYSCKSPHKLDENVDFRNHVLKPVKQPDHWSLHMWQALVGWHKNLMSVPNAIRDDPNSYFLEEDIDVVACHLTFETIFSGFNSNLLRPEFQQSCWITDASTPVRVGSQIIKGTKEKAQSTETVRLPQGAEFLALLLKHCSLSREQIYDHIIPYMERDEEKQPMSATAMERAAYISLHQSTPAPNKGKKSLTGPSQSKPSPHAAQPAKLEQSSHQQLDADLEAYNNAHEPILPYSEEPPSGEPDVEMHGPATGVVHGTLPDESTMNVDPELDDLYE